MLLQSELEDGRPYADFSALLGDGVLSPCETVSRRVAFNNPARARFSADVSVFGAAVITAGVVQSSFFIGDRTQVMPSRSGGTMIELQTCNGRGATERSCSEEPPFAECRGHLEKARSDGGLLGWIACTQVRRWHPRCQNAWRINHVQEN